MTGLANDEADALVAAGAELLQREAVCLDEQRWDDWLALFAEDCEYWMPAWKSDSELGSSPETELSHMYYANRAGLEDRVVRIRSGRAHATVPMARTAHVLSGILPVAAPEPTLVRLRSTWVCHVYFPRERESHAYFGRAEHRLERRDGRWLIAAKRSILLNDMIPTPLDVYCL